MEEEREERGESTESGTTSTQADTPTLNGGQESDELQDLTEPEEGDGGEACDSVVEPSQDEEDLCVSEADTLSQETLTATNTQGDSDCLPLTHPPTEVTPPPVSSHSPNTQIRQSEPCWYCLRSLDSEYRPEDPKQEDSNHTPPLPSSGQKVIYQTDPRPHFGVAWSSHSTCRPLWGSEGPCWGQRNQDVPNQTHTCPHCHLGLPPDTLRWHEAKCLLFEGLRNPHK